MVDTGSEISIINNNIIQNLSLKDSVKIPKITLIGASGKKLAETNRLININVKIGNKEFDMAMIVVKDIEKDIILGNDNLSKYNVKINYEKEEVEIEGEKVNFENENSMEEEEEININNIEYGIDEVEREMDIESEYKEDIENLLKKYDNLLNKEMRFAKNYVHKIEVKNIENFQNKTYQIPYRYLPQIKKELEELIKKGIKLNFTSIRHPSSNPTERYIQEIIKYLRITCVNNHKEWDQKLEEIEIYLNESPNTTTEQAPLYLLKGVQPYRNWKIERLR